MKKLIICLAVMFVTASINAQKKVNYTPTSSSQISKEWFDRFLTKHQDSVKVIADLYPKNDYDDCQFPLLVLYKKNQMEIIIFNAGDSSYIIFSPMITDMNNLVRWCGNKIVKLTHKSLIEAIRFKE